MTLRKLGAGKMALQFTVLVALVEGLRKIRKLNIYDASLNSLTE